MIDRRRVVWLCRRGNRELDLLLQAYLDRCFDCAEPDEQQLFVDFLDYPDAELQALLFQSELTAQSAAIHLVRKIRSSVSL